MEGLPRVLRGLPCGGQELRSQFLGHDGEPKGVGPHPHEADLVLAGVEEGEQLPLDLARDGEVARFQASEGSVERGGDTEDVVSLGELLTHR